MQATLLKRARRSPLLVQAPPPRRRELALVSAARKEIPLGLSSRSVIHVPRFVLSSQ
jgi:hypothetical protein